VDLLTHLFLPLTVAYAVRPDLFRSPLYFALGGVGVLADVDKFLLTPGLTHSLLTLGPVCVGILAVERYWRGEFRIAVLVVVLVLSHLLLDFVDGGPVPLLFPVVEQGVGLQYPARTVFGSGPAGLVDVEGPVATLRETAPRPDNRVYGLVNGAGVSSLLAFVAVVWGNGLPTWGSESGGSGSQ